MLKFDFECLIIIVEFIQYLILYINQLLVYYIYNKNNNVFIQYLKNIHSITQTIIR